MFLLSGQPLVTQDTQIASYGEWLLLNGKTSQEDLEEICREYFPFLYDLSLVLLDNPATSRRCSLIALASAIQAYRRYPGGAVLAWLARYTLLACRGVRYPLNRNYPWPALSDPLENQLWSLISGLDVEIQLLVVLYYRFGLSSRQIARICGLPSWKVDNSLVLLKALCERRLLWAGIPTPPDKVEQGISRALAHQLPETLNGLDQPQQIALELALALDRKKSRQHWLVILQQALVTVFLLAVLAYLYLH